ncbi:hypothetical protein MHM83_14105 [Tenacibaculum sp. Mcav3-52]|uniref:hypothetical protein n=1 Tax=Tenacibaculum sp. Mcav3-52 TaxID=2917762 RepID=UPI001EF27A06|nr:hypothetical protein [Tenacibaculum sp. Mcav3-52]MCG7503000.1 hypothetical protein [Tenacibaculum sp. Mcav3-52]
MTYKKIFENQDSSDGCKIKSCLSDSEFFLSVEDVVVFSHDFIVSLDFCFFLSRKRIPIIILSMFVAPFNKIPPRTSFGMTDNLEPRQKTASLLEYRFISVISTNGRNLIIVC